MLEGQHILTKKKRRKERRKREEGKEGRQAGRQQIIVVDKFMEVKSKGGITEGTRTGSMA